MLAIVLGRLGSHLVKREETCIDDKIVGSAVLAGMALGAFLGAVAVTVLIGHVDLDPVATVLEAAIGNDPCGGSTTEVGATNQ